MCKNDSTPYWFMRLGGKYYLRKYIIPLIPRDNVSTYIEPFVGSGKVLLGMSKFPHEVVNDLHTDTFYFWDDIKYLTISDIEKMDFIPSKETFNTLKDSSPSTPSQRFYKNAYLNCNSFSGCNKCFGDFSNTDQKHKSINYKQKLINNLIKIQNRLKGMTILNKDWKEVVNLYNSPSSFFYLDPPYYKVLGYGLPEVTPQELFDTIKTIKGRWLLSYNDTPIIRDLFKDYNIKSIMANQNIHKRKHSDKVGEVLISNY